MTSAAITGDFGKLRALIAKVENADQAKRTVLDAIAAEALTQVQLGFRESRDPDGSTWAPLKSRIGQPLRKTGRLNRSFTSRVMGQTVRVGTNVGYSRYHQHGTRNMPARRMLPSGSGLPKEWREPITKAANQALLRFWGKK